MLSLRVMSAIALLFTFCNKLPAGDTWPEWRGPSGQGHANAANLPVSWGEDENVAWKTEIVGRGWSTPVIADGVVWVTTATHVPASKEEAKIRRKTSTNSMPLTISDSASFRVVSLDLASGKILSDKEVFTEIDPQMIHVDNSYATPTPIIEDGRLYCHYGPYGIVCVDMATREVLWKNRTLRVKHENGPGSSPILWNDVLIIHCDGIDQQYIVALDKHTGQEAWKTARSGKMHDEPQMKKSYATSLVADVNGAPQVISPAADWVYAYNPETGKELWTLGSGQLGFSNSARPVAGHGLVYVCTGYSKSHLLAIKPPSSKDESPEVVWKCTKQVPHVSSPLLIGDELYFVSDNGIATCLDAKTGKSHWTARIGSRFWASPIYADGRIYFFDRSSTTTVITPGREFRKLATNKLTGEQLSGAAPVDGSLLIRTSDGLYCLKNE